MNENEENKKSKENWKEQIDKKQASVSEVNSDIVDGDVKESSNTKNPNPETKKRTDLKPGQSHY